MRFALSILVSLFLYNTAIAQNVGVVIDVRLSPAGSFKAETTKVTGYAQKTATGVSAENIEVDISSLKTGVELRDKHLKERLLSTQFPKAKLLTGQGENGKGTAEIEIKGQKKSVHGTYEIKGNLLTAQFKLLMSELDIKNVRYMGVGAKDEITLSVTVPLK